MGDDGGPCGWKEPTRSAGAFVVKVGYICLVNARSPAGHPAWILVSWAFPTSLYACVWLYLLRQSLHTLDQASPAPLQSPPHRSRLGCRRIPPAARPDLIPGRHFRVKGGGGITSPSDTCGNWERLLLCHFLPPSAY